jgi:hypothetical protein
MASLCREFGISGKTGYKIFGPVHGRQIHEFLAASRQHLTVFDGFQQPPSADDPFQPTSPTTKKGRLLPIGKGAPIGL